MPEAPRHTPEKSHGASAEAEAGGGPHTAHTERAAKARRMPGQCMIVCWILTLARDGFFEATWGDR